MKKALLAALLKAWRITTSHRALAAAVWIIIALTGLLVVAQIPCLVQKQPYLPVYLWQSGTWYVAATSSRPQFRLSHTVSQWEVFNKPEPRHIYRFGWVRYTIQRVPPPDEVLNRLGSSNPRDVLEALVCLELVPNPAATERLVHLTKDPDDNVRTSAATVLYKLGDPLGLATLERDAASTDTETAGLARALLRIIR